MFLPRNPSIHPPNPPPNTFNTNPPNPPKKNLPLYPPQPFQDQPLAPHRGRESVPASLWPGAARLPPTGPSVQSTEALEASSPLAGPEEKHVWWGGGGGEGKNNKKNMKLRMKVMYVYRTGEPGSALFARFEACSLLMGQPCFNCKLSNLSQRQMNTGINN